MDASSYAALTRVNMSVVLDNTGTASRTVVLQATVLNSNGQTVDQFPAVTIPMGGDPAAGYVTVNPGEEQAKAVVWNTGHNPPGQYRIVIDAIEVSSGRLLAQRAAAVDVSSTQRIGGNAIFDPPIAQLAAKKPIDISAIISNQGNEPIGQRTLTAQVILQDAGYAPRNDLLELQSWINDPSLSGDNALVPTDNGGFYVIRSNTASILYAAPDGSLSAVASHIYAAGIDADGSGGYYALTTSGKIVHGDAQGNSSTLATHVYGQALKRLPDGSLLVAGSQGIYHCSINGTVTKVLGPGLSAPKGLIASSSGDIFIADSGQNSIVKYANGELTTFASGIPQPYGVDSDASDNLYVTSFSDNALYRVSKDRKISKIGTGLGGPYDVKLRSDGTAIVSNNNENTIDTVAADGRIQQLVGPTINKPAAAVYAPDGSLYVANGGTSDIVSMKTDGAFSVVAAGIGGVSDATPSSDGGVDLLANSNKVIHMTPQGATSTIASGFGNGFNAITHSSDGGILLANRSQGRVVQIDASGAASNYLTRTIGTPIAAHVGPGGDLYVLSAEGSITRIDHGFHTTVIATQLSNPRGLAIDSAGNVYTSELYQNDIVKISPDGVVTRTATPFNHPAALAVEPDGGLLVATWYGTTIHKLDGSGTWDTFATTSRYSVYDMLVDSAGTVWVPNYAYRSVTRIASDGTQSVISLPGYYAWGVNPDGTGGAYVSVRGRVVHVDSGGAVHTVSTDPSIASYQVGAFTNADGTYTSVDRSGKVNRLDASGHFIAAYSSIYLPQSIAVNGGKLVVADGHGIVLDFTDPDALGRVLAHGSYSHVRAEPSGSVLLANGGSVSRLDVASGTMQSVANGYSNISGIAEAPDGTVAIEENTVNHIALVIPGSAVRNVYGLVHPKGLLIDRAEDLLVANSSPNAIMKVGSDGTLSMFAKLANVSYMRLAADGSVLATTGNTVRKLDSTGAVAATYGTGQPGTRTGVATAPDGTIYVASGNAELSVITPDGSLQTVGSGMASPSSIALDSKHNIYVSGRSRGVINKFDLDGTLHLKATGLSGVSAIAFGPDDTMYAAYANGSVASFDSGGVRRESPVLSLKLGQLSGLATTPDNTLYLLGPYKSTIYRAALPSLAPPQTGQVVYSGTASIQGLALDGTPAKLDFGSWTPTAAGDYQLKVSTSDGVTEGSVGNTLHVGPNADGTLSLARDKVLPGDRMVSGQLTVIGANSTSITQIDPSGATLAASSNTHGRAVTADPQGNLYSADSNRIVKITPSGQISDFVAGVTVGHGLAADAKGNIYAVSQRNILKITPNGTPTTLATLPSTAGAVAVNYADVVYAVANNSTLYRIDEDGTFHALTSLGLYYPRGLTIDAFGNFYILNANNVIVRVSPDGSSTTPYVTGARFEYEGVNLTADCSNNLLFAPDGYPELHFSGEESTIFQVVGDTGAVQKVLYGPSIDNSLRDMDVLAYDRFGKRMLMWTDDYGGKIYSFPVSCGSIDATAHVVARADVDLSSADPAPNQVIDRPDGLQEYVWDLNDVDNRGQTIDLNLLFHNLSEGEQRPMLKEAFLAYNNSFVPGDTVNVPLSIPKLTASSQMQIVLTLPSDSFGASTQVPITAQVTNGSDTPFDGTVKLSILDSLGNDVADLPPLTVSQLAATGSYVGSWDSGTTLVGDYTVRAQLLSAAGRHVATGTTTFHLVAGGTTGGTPPVTAAVTTDHATYSSWDIANLDILVADNSANAIAGPGTVQVTVTDPSGTAIQSVTLPLVELMPGGHTQLPDSVTLRDAPGGTYNVRISVNDAVSGNDVASAAASFQVVRTPAQALVGAVKVQLPRLYMGDSNVCTETVTNRGATAVSGVTITHKLINLDTGTTVAQSSYPADLAGGAADTLAQSISTDGLPAGGYSCVLSSAVGGVAKTLAHGSFDLMKPPIRIDSGIKLGNRGRLLVLLDSNTRPGDNGSNGDHDGNSPRDEAQCSAQTVVNLPHVYGKAISGSASVEVDLLDGSGVLLDGESAHGLRNTGSINQNQGIQGLDLSISQLTADKLGIVVSEAAESHGCAAATAHVRVSLWQGGALLPVVADEENTEGGLLALSVSIEAANDPSSADDQSADQPSLDAQRRYLEAALKAAGWTYTIVTDGAAFARELRSGSYMAYALLSAKVKLDEQVQKELREAVYGGAGLLVAGSHDERNNALNDPLGVRFDGKQRSYDGIEFVASPISLSGQQSFSAGGQALAIRRMGASVVANYFPVPTAQGADHVRSNASDDHDQGGEQSQGDDGKGDNQDPAAVTNYAYGKGHSVFAGFNLLAQATAAGGSTLFDGLLMEALDSIHPQPMPLAAGSVAPVEIDVTNTGIAVDARVVVTPPPGGNVFLAENAVNSGTGTATWSFHLDVQEQKKLIVWLRLPPTPGDATVKAVIQTASGSSDYSDYGTLNLSLAVTGSSLSQVKTAVDALAQEPRCHDLAEDMDHAAADFTAQKYDKALKRLVGVSDDLIRLDDQQADAIRLQLDEVIHDLAYQGWKAQ